MALIAADDSCWETSLIFGMHVSGNSVKQNYTTEYPLPRKKNDYID